MFDRAIETAEAAVRLHPHEPSGHEELIAAYRHYIAWTKPGRALDRLAQLRTPYATYFIGEIHRRGGRLSQADSIYGRLLAQDHSIPDEPILTSRAKVRIQEERYTAADAFIRQAMQFDDLVGARLLHGDFWYVLDDAEREKSRELRAPNEFREFYERLWARRDPTPAAQVNWRLVEHYRRLVVAEREFEFFGSRKRPMGDIVDVEDIVPAYVMEVDVPSWYYDVHGFNDKGLIYIRYGEPDRRIATQPRFAPPPDPGVPVNASWRYSAEGLDFHFVNPNDGGEAYSAYLVAALGECNMSVDRAEWGGFYQQIAPRIGGLKSGRLSGPQSPCGGDADTRSVFDATSALSKLADAGRDAIDTGLTTDRHTWATREVEAFDFPYQVVTFRGPEGRTDVSIYSALPVGWLSQRLQSADIPVEIGFAVHDVSGQSLAENTALRQYPRSEDVTKAAFEEVHFSVPPDSYRVSLHADLLGEPALGGYQIERAFPDYTRMQTMMSDLLVAYDIRPKQGHVAETRRSLQITANPFGRAPVDQPMHVYFEIYNLVLDVDDRAQYKITYGLQPLEKGGGVLGLFRRSRPTLSVTSSFEAETPSPIVFQQVDVSDLPPGEYKLTARVSDDVADTQLERSLEIELY